MLHPLYAALSALYIPALRLADPLVTALGHVCHLVGRIPVPRKTNLCFDCSSCLANFIVTYAGSWLDLARRLHALCGTPVRLLLKVISKLPIDQAKELFVKVVDGVSIVLTLLLSKLPRAANLNLVRIYCLSECDRGQICITVGASGFHTDSIEDYFHRSVQTCYFTT